MNLNFKKIGIGCAIAFIFGIVFGWTIFPAILKVMVKKQVELKKGSQMREMWEMIPFPLHFHVYVFNITNPNEVNQGGKPKLQEVGPYYFDEWKEKYNFEEDEEEDSISYNMKNTYVFRPDKSNGLTGEEIVTIPDVLYLSIGIVVKRERAPMLNLVSKALKIVFPNAKATLTGKFMDIFFRGVFVDCSSPEFTAKALCTAFYTGEVKGAIRYNETHFLFSLLGPTNATDIGRLTVCRGIKNIRKLGKVIRVNDEPELDIWNGDECNKLVGTDSTIFPPFLKREEGLWAYEHSICRSMGAIYVDKSSYGGLSASRYRLDMGDIQADENLHCYCDDPPDGCPLKGTMDLMSCFHAPFIASMPHFLNADAKLIENVDGLNPTENEHAILIDFERKSGTPLEAAKRIQFNLDVEQIDEIESMRNLTNIVIPIFWVEEGVQLNKTYVNMIKYSLFLGLVFNNVLRWSCIIIGSIGIFACGYFHMKKSQMDTVTVKPINKGDSNELPGDDAKEKDNGTITDEKY